jgi:hypothetical protein
MTTNTDTDTDLSPRTNLNLGLNLLNEWDKNKSRECLDRLDGRRS